MNEVRSQFEGDCLKVLDRYFADHPDAGMQKRAHHALRLLRGSEKPLKGKADGWAAGVLYAVATDGRLRTGVPGVLNAEFEKLSGVPMATARHRAAKVIELASL